MRITPRIFLYIAFCAGLVQGCAREEFSDAYLRRHYSGRWNLVSHQQTYSTAGVQDSSKSFSEAGYLVMQIDETFNENPIFISEGMADQMEMLGPLVGKSALEIVTNSNERRCRWSINAAEDRFSFIGQDPEGAQVVTVATLAKGKTQITLTYNEVGGPENTERLEETLVLEKD